MGKFVTILKREYAQIVKKKSFVIGLVLTPLIMGGFMLLPAFLATKEAGESESLAVIDRGDLEIADRFIESLERYKLSGTETPSYIVKGVFKIAPDDQDRFQEVYDSLAQAVSDKELD